jgi:argininosuccinate lyase
LSKLWGGRFSKPTAQLVHEFNASISFDVRLVDQDIRGSQAWAEGLGNAGILTPPEVATLLDGLNQVHTEFTDGIFEYQAGDEDIHTAVERRLTEIVGEIGGKLHTGRSRNDQVATDFRLWVLGACDHLAELLADLQRAIIANAEADLNTPMPGYTHLQHAQPVTWGHFLLSHFWGIERDRERLAHTRRMADECPLGSAALAGTGFPIDRHALAKKLGFTRISQNSLDGVSSRDFAVDFLYFAAMLGVHLSRLSEQLIIFASKEFSFVTLDDGYSTGSSLMPQKKNPDTLELTRGKAGRLIGNLVALLTTIKGLPSSYDKDLQEDKEGLFDAYDTLCLTIPVMAGLLDTLKLRPEKMAEQLEPSLLATDLADYLVLRGMPFRQAHEVVGTVVKTAEDKGVPITELSLTDLQEIHSMFADDVVAVFEMPASLAHRDNIGGTSPARMREQLNLAKKRLD